MQRPVEHDEAEDRDDDAEEREPSHLEPGRRHIEIQHCTGIIPNAVVITGHYVKRVMARAKLRVIRLTTCAYVVPIAIHAIELVTKQHPLRNGKAQGGVVNLQILRLCGKSKPVRTRVVF